MKGSVFMLRFKLFLGQCRVVEAIRAVRSRNLGLDLTEQNGGGRVPTDPQLQLGPRSVWAHYSWGPEVFGPTKYRWGPGVCGPTNYSWGPGVCGPTTVGAQECVGPLGPICSLIF